MLNRLIDQKEGNDIDFLGDVKQARYLLRVEACKSYDSKNFDEANQIMSLLVENTLGKEAIKSMKISDDADKDKISKVFHNAALEVVNGFRVSFDNEANYLGERETEFWKACDQEGPVAKKYLKIILNDLNKEKILLNRVDSVINNVYVEDAIKLSIQTLELNNIFDKEKTVGMENELLNLCKNDKLVREIFAKVVPTNDYYYDRIYREEKTNDESVLKFNNGKAHDEDDLRVIDLATRLANATWLAAQRHCAKKDGNMDRIDPNKRGGVFNTPDYRHIQQYKEAIGSGLSKKEAVMRVVFELSKDGWMLED